MNSLKRLLAVLVAAVLLAAALAAVPVFAEGEDVVTDAADTADAADPVDAAPKTARNIAAEVKHTSYADIAWGDLTDDVDSTHAEIAIGAVTIEAEEPIAGVYLKFYSRPAAWTVTVGETKTEHGQNEMLHEYVAIEPSTEIVLDFPRGAELSGLELYTEGTLPSRVQVWDEPVKNGVDLLMFATQASDEHTYMGGVLPLALAAGARCQVVFFCSHIDDPVRVHETLDGLWAIGMKNYPVLGRFPAVGADTLDDAKAKYEAQGCTEEDFIERQVECIRRFKPQVILLPDAAGEDGDFMSAINCESAMKAVTAASDVKECGNSNMKYGVWDAPKTYVHMLVEGVITLDLDAPLSAYGGRSAYDMACVGFAQHGSIHWTTRYEWLMGVDQVTVKKDPDSPRFTSATQIETQNPAKWGLWRSTVGEDTAADIFCNITLYDRKVDEPEPAETDGTPKSTQSPSNAGTSVVKSEPSGENPERDKLMIIAAICCVVLVAGLALVIGLTSSRSRKGSKKKSGTSSRSEENARRVREARLERSKADGKDDVPATRTVAESTRDVTGKGAEREAAIRAARDARESGETTHEKPTDKTY